MQVFPCPWCGPRDEAEFRYGGDAGKRRPGRDCSDAEWAEYLHMRDNRRGAAVEMWVHSDGCGRWFALVRDTRTHKVGS